MQQTIFWLQSNNNFLEPKQYCQCCAQWCLVTKLLSHCPSTKCLSKYYFSLLPSSTSTVLIEGGLYRWNSKIWFDIPKPFSLKRVPNKCGSRKKENLYHYRRLSILVLILQLFSKLTIGIPQKSFDQLSLFSFINWWRVYFICCAVICSFISSSILFSKPHTHKQNSVSSQKGFRNWY